MLSKMGILLFELKFGGFAMRKLIYFVGFALLFNFSVSFATSQEEERKAYCMLRAAYEACEGAAQEKGFSGDKNTCTPFAALFIQALKQKYNIQDDKNEALKLLAVSCYAGCMKNGEVKSKIWEKCPSYK